MVPSIARACEGEGGRNNAVKTAFEFRLPFSSHRARLVQTLTALAGTGAIITLVSLPISGWFLGAGPESREGGFAIILLLMLVAWSLAVAGHIFRHALSVPFFVGLVLAIVFYGISISVFRALFPPSA